MCSCVHPNIRILQPMFSLFFPWFHWSELEMRRQQSTKPSNVWFFFKRSLEAISGWLTPDSCRSLYFSLCWHFIWEKSSQIHTSIRLHKCLLCACTQNILYGAHLKGCSPSRARRRPSARQPFILPHFPFLLHKILHIYCLVFFVFDGVYTERDASVVLVLGHIGLNVHTFPPVLAFQNNVIYSGKLRAISSHLSGQMDDRHICVTARRLTQKQCGFVRL